jgi:DNA polymerase-3 subunit alpha
MENKDRKFVHLHVHSHYSLLDGLAKLEDLVQKAAADGMPALALTDHGVMYGAVEFYQKCKKAGIKPIIGVEAYIAENGRLTKEVGREKRYHVILLAKNNIGYKNLIKLTTIAHLEGFYYKPRIDWEVLRQYHEGIICLSACQQGEVAQAILNKTPEEAEKVALRYLELFGQGNYYLEVQYHPNLPKQKIVNDQVFILGKKLGIPVVATNDVHYLNTEDAEAHDILICLQTKKKVTDTDRMSYLGEDFSLYSTQQISNYFRGNPEVIDNTLQVAEQCDIDIELGKLQLPTFAVPEGQTPFQYLSQKCFEGVPLRYGFDPRGDLTSEQQKIVDRLNYELGVIEKTGYSAYFLIVQDFIVWAKSNGIVVGPGRGSAAGSLVAYLTQITNLDPLPYDLLFERFLNPDRISMPDIDTDFADVRRPDVIRYVESKYGKDKVSQIITFGTMAARAAVRDVGRVLDVPYAFCDKVAKLVPMGMDLDQAINQNVELKDLYDTSSDAKRLLDFARKLEGVARHSSTHACGILITPQPLIEYTPVQYSATSNEDTVSQYSLHPVEDLGLLKMDFLGLKNLTIMQHATEVIEKIHGIKIDVDKIPLDDVNAYKLFQEGKTTGVFQFESGGMKRYLRQLKPTVFEDIIAMVALYRPGPLNSGMVEEFIDRKQGRKALTYPHPIMESALKNTYGVIVYQEQVMQLSKDMAGFTGGQADTLRKAMGKKIADLMEKMRKDFVEGCIKNNLPKSLAEDTFASMEKFAEYGFNKSHAACYALIAYQTAYLKANYPAEFMASLLTSDQQDLERVAIEIDECKQMGIAVFPPDINESFSTFTVVAKTLQSDRPTIRFGLQAVRNLGEGVVKAIIHERKEFGRYESLEDFLIRVKSRDLNKKSLEGLAKCGALDNMIERNKALENIDRILRFIKAVDEEANNKQANLFSVGGAQNIPTLGLIEYQSASKRQRLSWEKEFLGLYVSEHPYSEISAKLESLVTTVTEIKKNELSENSSVITAGVISSMKKIITAKGEPMLFAKIEDCLTGVEVLVFPKLFKEFEQLMQIERSVIVQGTLSDKDSEPKVLANMIWEVTPANIDDIILQVKSFQPQSRLPKSLTVTYPPDATRDLADSLKAVFLKYPGEIPIFLSVKNQIVKTNFKVRVCLSFNEAVEKVLGPHSVKSNAAPVRMRKK